ncbi:MAG: RNA methyltransferase [Acidobacteriota bacterium]
MSGTDDDRLELSATCGVGLEPLLADELRALGAAEVREGRGAVMFRGRWEDTWRANRWLRTANRVLVALGTWSGHDGDALHAGARNLARRRRRIGGIDLGRLLSPDLTLSIRATTHASRITDSRWAALRAKDGLVDGQRDRHGRRSSVDREAPDLPLRLRLDRDQVTLFLDTSGEPLDRRGYRARGADAPLRETLAAACVLAAEWNGEGAIFDPMCGSGTLLVEAAWWALGWPPSRLRDRFAFEGFLGFNAERWAAIRDEPFSGDRTPRSEDDLPIIGVDHAPEATAAARVNLAAAGLEDARVRRGDAFDLEPPAAPGLLLINPPYGARLTAAASPDADRERWRTLGDLLKARYAGWRAVVVAGDEGRGKHIGLRPQRRLAIRNGPIEARLLVFDLY